MSKICSLSALLLFSAAGSFVYPQALIDIPITITSEQADTVSLHMGLDPAATGGLDTLLGEQNFYNHLPPAGEFPAFFEITPLFPTEDTLWLMRDYRNISVPGWFFWNTRLIWGMNSIPRDISIHYNLPADIKLRFVDEIGGVVINTPYLTGNGTLQVPDSISSLIIIINGDYNPPILLPAVNIPLQFCENLSNQVTLVLGLDPTATNGIDLHLGEISLPSIPPGTFQIIFNLNSYCGYPASTYTDIRNASSFPFSGVKQHHLMWMFSSPPISDTLFIIYNLPDYVSLQLKDLFGGVLYSSPTLTGSGTLTYSGPLTQLYIYATYNGAIPVELTSFTASAEGERVVLKWSTASETNNKGFMVQRKIKSSWEDAAFISGAGTSSTGAQYSYTDDISGKGITGRVFYRLIQKDYSGAEANYDPLSVEIYSVPDAFSLEQNYPNPFNPGTRIKYSITEKGLVM